MSFIRRFILAWQDATLKQTYEELADYPEYWTKDDLMWLGGVLAHPSGQKLMHRLNNMVIRSAIDATKRTLNPRYHCGIARGMAMMKTTIDNDFTAALTLASAQSGKTETTDAEREAAELEETLSLVT